MTEFSAAPPGEKLADQITADNAHELLARVTCPYCGRDGTLGTFYEPNNNATGIVCRNCGERHPLRSQRIMWLRHGEKRQKRSGDIVAVIKECGNYCYVCGTDFEILRGLGIGRHAHHTRAFAEHGDGFPKIPLCALCHEIANAVQRQMPKLLAARPANDELIDRIRQEFIRTLGAWFVGTAKGERGLERIMQCVRNAVAQHAPGTPMKDERK